MPEVIRKAKTFSSTLLFITLLLLLYSCNSAGRGVPVAHNGILNAAGVFPNNSISLYLDGEWDFYPNELIDPLEIHKYRAPQTILVPSLWDNFRGDEKILYATYRIRLVNHKLPPVFSIRNHQIFSAFTLFLDGEEILSNGVVSTSREREKPYYQSRTISVFSDSDTLDFVLHVSNHHYRRGGISESFVVGEPSSLVRNNMGGAGFDFFLTGSLLIMAIYYLSLFFVLKKELPSLYFSIFIFISILRILVTGQRLILMILPNISWEVMIRLEYSTFYLAPVFFILFLNAVFREEIRIFVVNIALTFSSVFTVITIFAPINVFTSLLPWYQGYISILAIFLLYRLWLAIQLNKEGAMVLLLGIVILFASLLHDMAFAYGTIGGTELFPAGLFLFILCQSYVLSIKFSLINKENQSLWEEIDYKNQNLELMVHERTRELQQQKNLLEKINSELEHKKKTMENQSRLMEDINELLEKEKEKSDQLLLNVLPRHIADELKLYGKSLAHSYPMVSVLFVDFVKFSDLSESLTPEELIKELHFYFAAFDDIVRKFNLEKIKTIGDSYMCAGGLYDDATERDVKNTVMAAHEMNLFIQSHRDEKLSMGEVWFDCRIGVHTGPVIAGVVGKSKFAFDIWGPTVNIAKRMESACEPGKVNISEFTYNYIKDDFVTKARGLISMKHKKNMQMFYVEKPMAKSS